MKGKIAVEEHFAIEETLQASARVLPARWPSVLMSTLCFKPETVAGMVAVASLSRY